MAFWSISFLISFIVRRLARFCGTYNRSTSQYCKNLYLSELYTKAIRQPKTQTMKSLIGATMPNRPKFLILRLPLALSFHL